MLTEDRLCLYCEKLLDKDMRKDAKFCNEAHRIAYNNSRRYGLQPEITRTDKLLHKNFEILDKLYKAKNKAVEVTKSKLDKEGFEFDFCTYIQGSFHYCYYYSFSVSNDKKDVYVINLASNNILELQAEIFERRKL